jgi:hypothetical protein
VTLRHGNFDFPPPPTHFASRTWPYKKSWLYILASRGLISGHLGLRTRPPPKQFRFAAVLLPAQLENLLTKTRRTTSSRLGLCGVYKIHAGSTLCFPAITSSQLRTLSFTAELMSIPIFTSHLPIPNVSASTPSNLHPPPACPES